MKDHKNIVIVVAITVICLSSRMYALGSDDAVVDSITAQSNLTQSDVDKWKFLWLGGAAEPATAAATVYGMYKAGTAGHEAAQRNTKLIKNVFKNEWMPQFLKSYEPSENVQGWMTGKWVWAGVGVTGVGIAAYKLLYPRVQAGIVSKIKKYVDLCKNLAVAKQTYRDSNMFYNALQQPGNTVWEVSDPIAQMHGFRNLVYQADIALLLIDQLVASGAGFDRQEVEQLRLQVIQYKKNVNYNYQFITGQVQQEKQKRLQERSEYGKELDIQSKEVGVAGRRVKNVANQWRLMKDIASTVGSAVSYVLPEDSQRFIKTHGPISAFAIAGYKGYQWWNAPGAVAEQPAPGQ